MNSLQIGMIAPLFDSIDNKNDIFHFSDYIGKKSILLYFYPKDDTPGCNVEAQDFRNYFHEFQKIDTMIIGVSTDNVSSHASFCSKYSLPFILISDENANICKLYGTYNNSNKRSTRSSFLIDKSGIIRSIWYNISAHGHASDVLRSATSLYSI